MKGNHASSEFYKCNVEHMKKENPKVWWKEVKRLCGFNLKSGNVSSHIHIEGIENLTNKELANARRISPAPTADQTSHR